MEAEKRLDSWKEIAAYLNRDVRTVIRWEKERGLPVRRVPGGKGHGVFALRRELDAWLHGNENRSQTVVAVLPFAAPPEHEFLGTGITENIIDRLSRLSQLRVMARTTVFAYKGRTDDARAIGKDLNAHAVVLGSVMPRQRFCEVTAELVDVRDGARLWGGNYLVLIDTLASVPARAASEVAQSLGIDDISPVLSAEGTCHPKAFEFYLRGRFHQFRYTEEDFHVAIADFERAIDLDPGYARAYAGLAECYTMMAIGYADITTRELLAKATDNAHKALALNETLSEAHLALGLAEPHHSFNLRLIQNHFVRAIELNPSYAMARYFYSYLLFCLGDFDEADAQSSAASELDPSNMIIQADRAALLAYMGRTAEAFALVEKCRHLTADLPPVLEFTVGIAHCNEGNFTKAVPALELCVQRSLMHTIPLGLLGHAYAKCGAADAARSVLQRLERESQQRPACVSRALVYAGFGDIEQTLLWLEAAQRERDLFLFSTNVWRWFDCVRDQPRFQRLMEQIGTVAKAEQARA